MSEIKTYGKYGVNGTEFDLVSINDLNNLQSDLKQAREEIAALQSALDKLKQAVERLVRRYGSIKHYRPRYSDNTVLANEIAKELGIEV